MSKENIITFKMMSVAIQNMLDVLGCSDCGLRNIARLSEVKKAHENKSLINSFNSMCMEFIGLLVSMKETGYSEDDGIVTIVYPNI